MPSLKELLQNTGDIKEIAKKLENILLKLKILKR
jgi:hypothetical protein